MIRKGLLVVICSIGLMIFVSTLYGQGSKKTITLPDGEVVCDLNGEWNALYEHYGPMQSVGNIRSSLKITQQGNTFVGKSLIDTEFSHAGTEHAGTEKIRGELDKDGIKRAEYHIPIPGHPAIGWTNAKGETSEDFDKIVFDTGTGVKVILERK
jgi:hypothetical protein